MMLRHTRTKGQALVEFTLAATLIFLLLAAAVDLGLIFFNLQGLHNAAQEGASYGSVPMVDSNSNAVIDNDGIRVRVRHEAGDKGLGFVNLLDLNKDGIDDASQPDVLNKYIQIETYIDTGNGPTTPCPQDVLNKGGVNCYIRVTVTAQYDLVFPLAPTFKPQFDISSSYVLSIRSTYIHFK